MTITVKKIIELLEEDGWRQVRMRGDHRIFKKAGEAKNVVVSGKSSSPIPTGTLHAILKDTGLTINK